jgi:putative transposase
VPRVSRVSRPGSVVLDHSGGVLFITARTNIYFYPACMPCGLERWHGGHDLHFITFSCYGRQPLLATAQRRDLFLEVLERVRRRYSWVVMGYVVMPEHVHLLVSEPPQRPLSTAIQALKLGFARRVLGERRRQRRGAQPEPIECGPQRIWQARYYDFNVCTADKRIEKLRYIHRNPVTRGLVEAPEVWRWSSFRTYAYQEKGPVGINQWGVPKLKSIERTSFPT